MLLSLSFLLKLIYLVTYLLSTIGFFNNFKPTKNLIRPADSYSSWSMTDKEINPSPEGTDLNLQRFKFGFGLGLKVNNINENLNLHLTIKQKNVINQLNGFYGLIGPNINMENNVDSLYDLFMGDGVIQGVFFENGNLTYVKHLIKTEKVLYEEKFGTLPKNNNFLTMFFLMLNKMKLFPNVLGMANTAILSVKNEENEKNKTVYSRNNYALFERDYPYLLDIDFKHKDIKTIKKINIDSLSHFSGHSKITNNGNIETIDYQIVNNIVNYVVLNNKFNKILDFQFKFKYLPIIHDFFSNDDLLILIDSPLLIDFTQNIQNKMPVFLDNNKNTFIYVYDKKNNKYDSYDCDHGFYTFHYADVKNKKNTIEIYISMYDELHFTNVNIKGKYRMIEINKDTKKFIIHKNKELEKYNLDFPICFDDKVILRNFENRRINGFIITKKLSICKKLFFENKNICGEHNVIYINKIPYLIFFNVEENKVNKTNKSFLTLINLHNYEIIDIEIKNKLNLGFHSIFLHNS